VGWAMTRKAGDFSFGNFNFSSVMIRSLPII